MNNLDIVIGGFVWSDLGKGEMGQKISLLAHHLKPICVGAAIQDIAEIIMYEFLYNYISKSFLLMRLKYFKRIPTPT